MPLIKILVRMLVISDTHIPDRSEDFPHWVKELVERGWDVIVHLGDVTAGWVLQYLSYYTKNLVAVKGNNDMLRLPEVEELKAFGRKFVALHGHQIGRRPDYEAVKRMFKLENGDILLFGHSHIPELTLYRGVMFLNPGTATGAWTITGETRESVAVIDPDGVKILVDGKILKSVGWEALG